MHTRTYGHVYMFLTLIMQDRAPGVSVPTYAVFVFLYAHKTQMRCEVFLSKEQEFHTRREEQDACEAVSP